MEYSASQLGIEWKFREAKSGVEILSLLNKYHSTMDPVCWLIILRSQHFMNRIFEEYKKEIPWRNAALFRDIPEKYLEEFFEEIDLYEISSFAPLSLNFIKKHYDKLSLNCLVRNEKLTKDAKAYAVKLYNRYKDNPSYHKRWDFNLSECKAFAPKNFEGHYNDYDDQTPFPSKEVKTKNIKDQETQKQNIIVSKKVSKKVVSPMAKYEKKSKAELKKILAKRGVRVYYHDTLEILRKKCVESEVQK